MAGRVRGVLPGLQNLVYFESNWRGPSHGVLAALPRGLTRLYFMFDLDAEVLAALRSLDGLVSLVVSTGNTVELGPPQSKVHQCAAFAKDTSILRALQDVSAPHCCIMALVPGRSLRRINVITLVTPDHIRDLFGKVTVSHVAFIATLLFGGGLALEIAARYPQLEHLELVDLGIQRIHLATESGVGNALRSLPHLRIFRLFTAMEDDFQLDAIDENTLREMIMRWTRSASPALECIRLGRIDIGTYAAREGGPNRWTSEWFKQEGKWLQSSKKGYGPFLSLGPMM
ncbi:hypothetical protein AURDEDRAFT_112243 [Auricularia subglabra TFB-10046 SS5]|nr:hypothetical protein AURDEDRAFT_112243 [Auricularia subglabra TFB-10046 SS5]